jgi:sugar/nucleoside kinase (ribokinase family)
MNQIVVAGHLCLDVFPTLPSSHQDFMALLTPGRLVAVGPLRFATGGAVSNTGLACVRFGAPVRLMALTGDDLLGTETRRRLEAAGGDSRSIAVRRDVTTSYTIVLEPPGLDRIFLHHTGANDQFDASAISWADAMSADLFHFGYPPLMAKMYAQEGEALLEIIQKAHGMGLVTSMDMALPDPLAPAGQAPWETILRRVLPLTDFFLPSIEESLYMLDPSLYRQRRREAGSGNLVDVVSPGDVSAIAHRCLELGAAVALIKCGHRGLYLRTAGRDRLVPVARRLGLPLEAWTDRELWQPCFHVETVVGTTGAGDSAIAGFLCAAARSLSAGQALRYAAAAGSYNVTQADSLSGLVDWSTMTERLAQGWSLTPFSIAEAGWTFHSRQQWWTGPADARPERA